jgi:hypothetical protein
MKFLTIVIIFLALIFIASVAYTEMKPDELSIFDLKEFKELPYELRLIIKPAALANVKSFKKSWNTLDAQQKEMITHGLSQAFSIPLPSPAKQNRPPAPSTVIKPTHISPERIDETYNKDTDDKKKNEIITLSDIGVSDDEEVVPPLTD